MLRGTIPLGRYAGVPVGAHWSVLVILVLLTDVIATSVLPAAAPGHATGAYWGTAVAASVCFLASLLAHELGHAVTARHYGVGVRRITLWLLGGAAELEGSAPNPRADFVIAAIGPAISLVLGGLCWGTAFLAAGVLPELVATGIAWIGITNVVLALFNLLPGTPLDGGRVLRAAVWKRTGDRARAALVAGRTGQVLGVLLMVLGVGEVLVLGQLSGLWLALIGWFLVSAAQAELTGDTTRSLLGDRTVRAVLDPAPVTAPGWLTVEAFLDTVAVPARARVFPVVSFDGAPLGVVALGELARLPPRLRFESRIADVARPLDAAVTAGPDERLADVLARTALRPGRDLLVVLDHGRLAGAVTADDLARTVELAVLGKQAEALAAEPHSRA
ncbi:site-2 protease family protein [Amycolatopsis thermoflava]|uniref:site-2 protease family protein n=1 Tax=Amycolatopsis thermoflava TaxID=84480 RepID=UPI0036510AE0